MSSDAEPIDVLLDALAELLELALEDQRAKAYYQGPGCLAGRSRDRLAAGAAVLRRLRSEEAEPASGCGLCGNPYTPEEGGASVMLCADCSSALDHA